MIADILLAAAMALWLCSTGVLLLSFAAALIHPLSRRDRELGKGRPPVTAIVPVKALHAGFERAQRSLVTQDYPGLEIVLVAAETDSPALIAAQLIAAQFPEVDTRTVISECTAAASPKLNNLWPAIRQARNDVILTKDSNLALEPGELASLVDQLDSGAGLVSTISIATEPRSFAAWIEASIINCYHARVLMLADAAGLGFGLGKVMLFRRTDVMKAGGFARLGWALGEDMALAQAINGLGLRTVLASRVSNQPLGPRRFSEFWQRQLRWMVVWRTQLPAAFVGDLLGSAFPTAIAGALAAAMLGYPALAMLAGTLILWFCLESVLCIAKGWPVSTLSPVAFIAREILTPVLWLQACTTSRVVWAGQICEARRRPSGKFVDTGVTGAHAQKCDQ